MTKTAITWWSVFTALTIALLSGHLGPSNWPSMMWGAWIIMGISYSISAKSTASTGMKITHLVITATFLAVIAYSQEGEPSRVEDVYSEGGYAADHKDKSSAAVRFFIQIMISGYVGIFLSEAKGTKKE